MESKHSISPDKQTFRKYYQLTSPLNGYNALKNKEELKEQLKTNLTMRLDLIKQNSKHLSEKFIDNLSLSDIKANSYLYKIPQFSTPEINYEVSEKIKKKVEEMKNQIITHFPQISKSSNYAPKKLNHQMNHRSVIRELDEWLKIKLQNPPCNYNESIEYKNMIMGVGMKQLIRIISKRCLEQGKMAEDIWQLTWSICRQIIIYLSKRAKKCEDVLEEQVSFLKKSYQKQYNRLTEQNKQLSQKIENLTQQNKEFYDQLIKLRKRVLYLDGQYKNISYGNHHLQQQFKHVLEQNLALYLQIGDKNKRGWIKKMYKQINSVKTETSQESPEIKQQFKDIFKDQVKDVVNERLKLEEITGDNDNVVPKMNVDNVVQEINQLKPKKHKNKKRQKNKDQRLSSLPSNFEVFNEDRNDDDSEQDDICEELVYNLRQQFLPINAGTQTEEVIRLDIETQTTSFEFCEKQTQIQVSMLHLYCQIGVNTEQIKQESKAKKKLLTNRQNLKQNKEQTKSKDRSKIMNNLSSISSSKMKSSTNKNDKDKKGLQNQDVEKQKNKIQKEEEVVQRLQMQLLHRFSQNIKIPSQNKIQDSKIAESKNKSVIIETNNISMQLLREKMNSRVDTIQTEKDHSLSIDAKVQNLSLFKEDYSPLKTIQQSNIYICSQCNKIINEEDQKFQQKKFERYFAKERINLRIYEQQQDSIRKTQKSPLSKNNSHKFIQGDGPIQRLLEQSEQSYHYRKRQHEKKQNLRKKQKRRSSGYMHDIAYKKQIEENQFKSSFYGQNKIKDHQPQQKQQQKVGRFSILSKTSAFRYFYDQTSQQNQFFINNISGTQQQTSQNLQHYFQMVKQINSLPDGKLNITQKSVCSTIQKNIFPLMNQLMNFVKKSWKANKISQTMKNFTSLPNIVYNRMSRKYGMKILAIKNMKILLMALKASQKFTDKYKMIQLMMFTDCKAPHSEDLYIYLLVMSMLDPTFSSSKIVTYEQATTIKKVCQEHLSRQKQVYTQFEKLTRQDVQQNRTSSSFHGLSLLELIKSIITSYRLLKITKIQELGFIFLMLKKQNCMDYKIFVYFLSTFSIEYTKKVFIAKKLLEFCDIKSKDKKIGISQNMFSKFLMNCQIFTLQILMETIKMQKQSLEKKNQSAVDIISQKVFTTKNLIKTVRNMNDKQMDNDIEKDIIPQMRHQISEEYKDELNEKDQQQIEISPQVKQYSFFTYRISKYLENSDDTKYLTYNQHHFIKDYLIIHILQCEMQKVVGIVDYFSNSMLQLICLPQKQFQIENEQLINNDR